MSYDNSFNINVLNRLKYNTSFELKSAMLTGIFSNSRLYTCHKSRNNKTSSDAFIRLPRNKDILCYK